MRPGRHWYLVVALVLALAIVATVVILASTNDGGEMDDMPGMDMGLGDVGRS